MNIFDRWSGARQSGMRGRRIMKLTVSDSEAYLPIRLPMSSRALSASQRGAPRKTRRNTEWNCKHADNLGTAVLDLLRSQENMGAYVHWNKVLRQTQLQSGAELRRTPDLTIGSGST